MPSAGRRRSRPAARSSDRAEHAQEAGLAPRRPGVCFVAAHEQMRRRRRADVVQRLDLAPACRARASIAAICASSSPRGLLLGVVQARASTSSGLTVRPARELPGQVLLHFVALVGGRVDGRFRVGADRLGQRGQRGFAASGLRCGLRSSSSCCRNALELAIDLGVVPLDLGLLGRRDVGQSRDRCSCVSVGTTGRQACGL